MLAVVGACLTISMASPQSAVAAPNAWSVSPCRSDVLVYDAYSGGVHTGSWYYTTRKGYVWVDDGVPSSSPYGQYRNRNYECGVMGAPVTPMGQWQFYGTVTGQWFQGGLLEWGQQPLPTLPKAQWPYVWIWHQGNWGQW